MTYTPSLPIPRQLILPFFSSVEHFETPFLKGPSNEAACTWLYAQSSLATWPEGRLVLWGEEGVGKSHLLHVWARYSNATLIPAAIFRPGAEEDLLGLIGQSKGMLIGIDDADTLREESLLLHVLNFIGEQSGKIVMVGRTPSQYWPFSLPDLQSRMRAVHNVSIEPPDDGLLYQLIVTEAQRYQLMMTTDIVAWLLHHLPRTTGAVKRAVYRLNRLSLSLGRRVTKEMASQILQPEGG